MTGQGASPDPDPDPGAEPDRDRDGNQDRDLDPDLDRVLAALAHAHRRGIVHVLGLQPASISRLAEHRGLSLPAIHKHVTVLEDAGLVRRRKTGRTTYLTLQTAPLRRLQDWLARHHTYWASDQSSLENYHARLDRAPATADPTPPEESP